MDSNYIVFKDMVTHKQILRVLLNIKQFIQMYKYSQNQIYINVFKADEDMLSLKVNKILN